MNDETIGRARTDNIQAIFCRTLIKFISRSVCKLHLGPVIVKF